MNHFIGSSFNVFVTTTTSIAIRSNNEATHKNIRSNKFFPSILPGNSVRFCRDISSFAACSSTSSPEITASRVDQQATNAIHYESVPKYEKPRDQRLKQITVYVIGSGITGLFTAYELVRQGFHVIVFDERPESGTQCTIASCGVLNIPLAIGNAGFPTIEVARGWWYWSSLRSKLMKLSLYRKVRNFVIRIKRRYLIPQEQDPELERLEWNRLLSDESLRSSDRIKDVEMWMAPRTLPYNINLSSTMVDPHFIRWLADYFVYMLKTNILAICERTMQYHGNTSSSVDAAIRALMRQAETIMHRRSSIGSTKAKISEKRGTDFPLQIRETYIRTMKERNTEDIKDEILEEFRMYSIQRLKEIIEFEGLNCSINEGSSNLDQRELLVLATTLSGLKMFQKATEVLEIGSGDPRRPRGRNDVIIEKGIRKTLSPEMCISRYSQLSKSPLPNKGGILIENIESVNLISLVKSIEKICREKYGVQFAYETKVIGFVYSRLPNKRFVVSGFKTSNGNIPVAPILSAGLESAEQISYSPIIFANGAWIPKLSAQLGLYVPIYPAKGITLVFEPSKGLNSFRSELDVFNQRSIRDGLDPQITNTQNQFDFAHFRSLFAFSEANHSQNPVLRDRVFWVDHSRSSLRISAFFEFDGWKLAPNNTMKNGLVERTKLLYPQLFEEEKGRCAAISGLRPMTSDKYPIIGHLHHKYENVYINSGGGDFGLGIAAGSGVMISEMITKKILRSITSSLPSGIDRNFYLFSNSESFIKLFSPLYRVSYAPRFCRFCIKRWNDRQAA